MPYKPTGRPSGRPKNPSQTQTAGQRVKIDPPPSAPKEEPVAEPEETAPVVDLRGLCAECFPQGWPAGATGLGCQHGSWTKTATGIV